MTATAGSPEASLEGRSSVWASPIIVHHFEPGATLIDKHVPYYILFLHLQTKSTPNFFLLCL